ncbi:MULTISPECIES: hypothetical protein [unclassified Rhizobacter]|uniref:hypothetical protein n=1 Tax=unclassified Rhizobacter TaxID=2640088 RepID=UPI000AF40763|nr:MULTISPECIES: hypothetical protein [unclassified Rhizobacter]
MASDADWMEDVRRWALGEPRPHAAVAEPSDLQPPGLPDDLGYEAAHPALQARHWPDALPFKS